MLVPTDSIGNIKACLLFAGFLMQRALWCLPQRVPFGLWLLVGDPLAYSHNTFYNLPHDQCFGLKVLCDQGSSFSLWHYYALGLNFGHPRSLCWFAKLTYISPSFPQYKFFPWGKKSTDKGFLNSADVRLWLGTTIADARQVNMQGIMRSESHLA